MCSVRQSPIPSAPKSRPRWASAGVSALTRTRSWRIRSAHCIRRRKSPPISGVRSAAWPANTLPVLPSTVIQSPWASFRPFTPIWPARSSTCRSCAPTTHGLPMPRATTAAWEVMPPRAVSTALAITIPWKSSGEVSRRTRITAWPERPSFSA